MNDLISRAEWFARVRQEGQFSVIRGGKSVFAIAAYVIKNYGF